MESSDTMLTRSLFRDSQPRGVRRVALIKAWELSGAIVARYYDNLLRRFGAAPQALDERTDVKEHQFYDRLFDGAALPPAASILDVGCGLGNLITYLQDRGVQVHDYLGVDLVPQFIELCRAQYAPPFAFAEANFISDSFRPDRRFDLVISMGVLVSRVLFYERYIEYSIRKMIALSSKYVLFNVITDIDGSLGNYRGRKRIGQITFIPKSKLFAILDAATSDLGVRYELHEVNIYPDATDAFVCITVNP
jgi:SAM-dependent methyltransferase